ncbi:MAG: hypothetical protein IKU36_06210 [Bacteroidales bacterium]|nr:hypothetical protein [Bacteroidales bacterium]
MPDNMRIPQLTLAEQTSDSDLFETAIPDALSSTGYRSRKNSLATLATFMANTLAFTNLLDTNAKTLIGAINELYAGGGGGGASVSMGTTDPSDASGSNGDLYVKYDGTSYAVLGFWVKINNAWRTISTGGGTAFVEITQADYNQLSYADRHSGIPYLITDGVLPAIEAGDVTYDNTGSTLSADDVNEAIDELDAEKITNNFTDLPTDTIASNDLLAFSDVSDSNKPKSTTAAAVAGLALSSLFKMVTFNLASCSVPANSNKTLLGNAFVDTTDTIPSGYSPMAFVGDYSTNNNIIFNKIECTQAGGTGIFVTLKNITASDQTGYIQVKVLYIKSGAIG